MIESNKHEHLRLWLLPALFIAAALIVSLPGDAAREFLRYDRVWIAHGEGWRFVTGHFAHLSGKHLLLNSAGLVLVWFLVGARYSLRSWILIIAVTLTVMDVAFWYLKPELHWYVGMSGMLHGLLAAGIIARYPDFDAESLVLIVLLLGKVGWEQYAGPVPGSELTSGGPVVVDAHLYGTIGGIIGALLTRIRVKPPASI